MTFGFNLGSDESTEINADTFLSGLQHFRKPGDCMLDIVVEKTRKLKAK